MAANHAVVLEAIKDIQLKEYPMPEMGDSDCLVEMKSIGICGSDVHYWQHGRIGDFVCDGPMVLGHESAGVIVKVGKDCKKLKVGDRVALEAGVPCAACEQCTGGKYNLCPDIKFFATPPVHGSLARYVAHPEKWIFPIPDNMTLEEGAMCEPLSVGVYACVEKAKVEPGKTYSVFGAGPIGTICALVANGLGAGKIILCDIQQNRLDFCKKIIPSMVVLNTTGMSGEEVAEAVKAANGGEFCDGSIDCAGVESVVTAAIKSTKNGGSVCLVGMGKPTCTLPLLDASIREVDLNGVFRYRNTYPKCIELLSTKKVDLDPLITHRFEFTYDSVMDAFETCRTGRDGAIKCMINIKDTPEHKF
eukprot:TRINITY_DN6660_c5_g1_i1.p1 TRINITY_DN6660_c5_g1~~TRINITY_DN6660_c5_g1_i1.p1  ORF type:complete len:361 (+),score=77.67 TRINITY_DN6660_c5_g1_i1:53-1135(+)